MIDGTVDTEDFIAIGISHWNTPVEIRERFSLNTEQTRELIQAAKQKKVGSLFVVTTCNRTEIFAQDAPPQQIVRLLINFSNASFDDFDSHGFRKQGRDAIDHLFQVAVGLNSQVLGDVQIIKQVKDGYKFAAGLDAVSGEMHQLLQHVFRAHKQSRNETSLGGGAATTAYAAVKFATQTFNHLNDKQILLVGAGKIGKVTCKNLISLGVNKLTLINRTRERAEFVANKFDLQVADMSDLPEEVAQADLVIVATGADQPIIGMEQMQPSIQNAEFKVMVDLAVPRNVDPEIQELPFVDLANMDLLTDVTRQAQQKREQDVPYVKKIIRRERADYEEWLDKQAVVPTIKALTSKFDRIREDEYDFFKNKIDDADRDKVEHLTERIVNKIAAYSIEHLRNNHESKQVTQVVSDMFELEIPTSDG